MSVAPRHTLFATGRQKLLGHLAMIGFAAFVAGSFSFGAIAAPHVAPAALNAVRFAIGTGVMTGVAMALTGGHIEWPRAVWRYGVLGALMAAFFVTMFVALRFTDPVSSGAVFTLMPIASAGFGWLLLGQVPRGTVVVSIVLAAVGSLWVVFRGDLAAAARFEVGRGELIFFAGVLCHAAYGPLIRRFNRGEEGVVFTLWTVAATGLCLAAWGLRDIVATDWMSLPTEVWVTILYLATFTSGGSFFLTQYASMRLPAAKVLAYSYLTPVFIILYEGLMGHGWASAPVVAGASVIVLGLLVMAFAGD
ncbi:DMT family transporter [Mesorhizobium sp. J428]|uniref:DMT family transporter n=1 Tax=Mesorhizobium sp. J428 TaxID=2898440 RepID=UPI0021516985|nr:DMT family transporter [Mesorhizobium sp. J428]MCR5855412.1 DMT family transporter [Mesorhizobium sp. J428]